MKSRDRRIGQPDAIVAAPLDERAQCLKVAHAERRLPPALALGDERGGLVVLPDREQGQRADVAQVVVIRFETTLVAAHDEVPSRHARRYVRAEPMRLQVRADRRVEQAAEAAGVHEPGVDVGRIRRLLQAAQQPCHRILRLAPIGLEQREQDCGPAPAPN